MSPRWMKITLLASGLYNIAWGMIVIAFPNELFALAGMQAPQYPELFQCIGMMIAVYGAANIAASPDPLRYWPVVFAGFLGRVLGPIGYLAGLQKGVFTLAAGVTILTNDLIWVVPFGLILWVAFNNARNTANASV